MHFRRFKLLMWKNYRWRRHFWIWTLIEALVPILIAIYVPSTVLIKSNSENRSSVTKHSFAYKPANNETFLLQKTFLFDMIAYTPPNALNKQLVENVVKVLNELPTDDLDNLGNITREMEMKSFTDEDDLEAYMFDRNLCSSCIGIVFEISENVFKYKLRMNEFTRTLGSSATWGKIASSQYDMYLDRGFAGIQLLLNKEFIRLQINKTDWHPSQLHFQGFPSLEYKITNIPRNGFIIIASLSIIITSIALSIPFINAVIQEKESGVMELMKIHGVDEWMIWLSWLLHAFIVPAISLSLMIAILKAPILTDGVELVCYVTYLALWSLLMLYSLANIAFVCLFCAIFHKGIVASFAFIFVLMVNFVWIAFYHELNLQSTAIFIALIPASAFATAIETVQKYEELGEPFGMRSFGSISYAVGALIFDFFLYSLLTLYITSINPGTYGVAKTPLFFLKFFTRKAEKKTELSKQLQTSTSSSPQVKYVEPSTSQLVPLIQVKNLSKHYGSSYAINSVDLAIYENEVLVLLGHNGAGKSTLLSIIAGVRSYDEGILNYQGADLKENLDTLRANLGICFQEERLFSFLSVLDHLVFYSMLKGSSKTDAIHEAVRSMNLMELREKETSKVDSLPFHYKRKLSLAIALLKKPKMLILDEPTFGIDFSSKRRVWSILNNLRRSHTIILSTGYAKEAERLADRIAIFQNGYLITHGTQTFLEKTFGTGYELIITMAKITDHAPLMELIKTSVPNALVAQEKPNEMVFKIPAEDISKFSQLFKQLEENKTNLGILNVEMNYATLEQILTKIQNESLKVAPKQLSKLTDKITTASHSDKQRSVYLMNLSNQSSNLVLGGSNYEREKGFSLKVQQIRVLLGVKIFYTKRNYVNVLIKIGLPSLILAIVLLTATKVKPKSEMNLKLEEFHNPTILLQKTNSNTNLHNFYSNYIEERDGIVIPFYQNETAVEKLLDIGDSDRILFGTSLLAAFEFGETTINIYYNQWELKALPLAINLYSNILLKTEIKTTSWKIENINKPMPDISEGQCGKKSEETYRLAIVTLLFIFFAFYTIDFILYCFEFTSVEIARKLMHLQRISSVSPWIYWLAALMFDFIFFIFVVAVRLSIVMFLSDVSLNLSSLSAFHGTFMLMIILFGIGGLLCTYSMSFLFKTTRSLYASFLVLNALCSISMYTFNRIEGSILSNEAPLVFGILYYPLKYLILFIPFLNFTLLFNKFLEIWKHNSACDGCQAFMKSTCEENLIKLSFWNFPSSENPNGLALGLLFLFIDIFFYAIFLTLINMGYIDHWYNILSELLLKRTEDDHEDESSDIKRERMAIKNIKKDKSKYNKVSFIAEGLSQNYFKSFKPVSVVENVSFMAQRGTCFGILGVNGAGKTTIFKMLSAEIYPNKGVVSIEGVEMNTKKNEYISMIGYSPQTSPLHDDFTGKEMLKIFGLLNGIKRNDIELMVNEWISTFGLEKMQNKKCRMYDHSSKRKLCVAIAYIGNPKLIFLDEPTSGIDPDTKYKFHEIIVKSKESGKTVILGSISMDECQKLCDKLIILMNGEMHCIGSVAYLKKRYEVGFSVTIRIRRDESSSKDVINLEQNIISVFNHKYCFLKEEHRDMLYYHIKDPSLTWSILFERMENIKKNNKIVENYILKNISLKEVFTAFSQPEHTSSKSTFRYSS